MSGGTIGSGIGAIVGGIIGSYIPGVGTMLGAYLGSMVGGVAGSLLFPPEYEDMYGARNRNLQLPGSAFGNPISRTWGTDRHAGNLIWTSGVREIPVETEVSNKGGSSQTTINFTYRASYAVAIAAYAGEDTKLLRIWSDNKLILDLTSTNKKIAQPFGLNYRFYIGSETQEPDPTIESYEGAGNIPAHRGLIYIVYEDRDLTPYGGRYPSDNFEITTNGTGAWPSDVWTISADGDCMKYDSDRNLLYFTGFDSYFSIMNTIDNSLLVKEAHSDPHLQYTYSIDICKDGSWLTAEISTGTVYLTKVDPYLLSSTRVVDPVYFLPIRYSVWGIIVNCESVIWMVNWTGAAHVSFDLIPLHDITYSGGSPPTIATYVAEIEPITDHKFLHGCYAPNYGIVLISAHTTVNTASRLYLIPDHDVGRKVEIDITAYMTDAKYVGYEPDNGWIFIGGDDVAASGKIIVYDSTTETYVKTVGTGIVESTNQTSTFRNIVNHRLWTYDVSAYHEIDTLTGEVVRSLPMANWTEGASGGVIYDPVSNALWVARGTKLSKLYLDRASGAGIPLSTIVEEISNEVSLTDAEIDVTELTNIVYGYTVNQRMSARRALEPLQLGYFFDGVESDAKIKYLKRALRTSVVTIPQADLSCHDPEAERPDEVSISRQFELEIPRQLDLEYVAPNTDYQQGKQTTTRLITLSKEQKTVTLPICFETDEAKQISEILHYLMWLERNRFKLNLSRKYAYLDNCDVVTVVTDEATYLLRITKLEYGAQGLIICDMVPHDADTFLSTSTGNDGEWVPGTEIDYVGDTIYYFMDLPFFRDLDQNYKKEGFYVALTSNTGGWHGATVYKSADGSNFSPSVTGVNSAKQGIMMDVLTAVEDPNVWDTTSSVRVQLFNSDDTLSSTTDDAVLNGANPCVIRSEICQFVNATLVTSDPKVYTLSRFLRGRRGTEAYVYAHSAGERFVFLTNTSIYRSDLDLSEIGLQRNYAIVSIGDKLDTSRQIGFHGHAAALKPLCPVHVSKALDATDDWIITWIRRTRIGGSWRDLVDVPLSETTESYQIDIYDDTMNLLRTESTSAATYTYEAADQTADGITPGDPIKVHVYQMSETVGRGYMGGDGHDLPPEIPSPVPPIIIPPATDITFNLSYIKWQHPLTLSLNSGRKAIGEWYMDAMETGRTWKVNPIIECKSGTVTYTFTFKGLYTKTGSVAAGSTVSIDINSFEVAGVADPYHGFNPVTGMFKLVLTASVATVVYIPEVKIFGWP